jgi:hypothetical protein
MTMKLKGLYGRHFAHDPQAERALLSAVGFTGGFAACRAITHSIKAGVGPFHNLSAGGRHLHHSTPGILGLIAVGFVWAQRAFTGEDAPPQWGSRITATLYGIFAAMTLDEFALWMDLNDDYWDAQGRKSIDAAVIFGGLMNVVAILSAKLDEDDNLPAWFKKIGKLDIKAAGGPVRAAGAGISPDGGTVSATTG